MAKYVLLGEYIYILFGKNPNKHDLAWFWGKLKKNLDSVWNFLDLESSIWSLDLIS